MELKQLEYFIAVSDAQSFTRAAEQLHISQPSVTTAIKSLEKELGIVLFDRTNKKPTLTGDGQIFYDHICVVMYDISKAAQKAAELKNLSSGNIKIGISPLTCLSATTFLLAKFHNSFPALKLIFTETSTEDIEQLLENENIDLGFIFKHHAMEALEYAIVSKETLFAYMPTSHRLGKNKSISLQKLFGEKLILPRRNSQYRVILDNLFAQHGLQPDINFETNYIQMIKNLIISGSGIALLPKGAIDNNAICSLPLQEQADVEICIAKKKNRNISHAAETLYAFFK